MASDLNEGMEGVSLDPQYGEPIAALYTGDKLLKHVTAFVKKVEKITKDSNDVKLYVCSPFYSREYQGRYDASVIRELMKIILRPNNLTTVFYSRLKADRRNQLIDYLLTEHENTFREKLLTGKIEVWEAVPPDYFHCKWLAIDKGKKAKSDERVELLVTSANLTSQHLYEEKPKDVKPEDVKPEDVKPEDVKPEDVKPEEADFKKFCKKRYGDEFKLGDVFKQVDFAEHKFIGESKFSQDFREPIEDICWRIQRDADIF